MERVLVGYNRDFLSMQLIAMVNKIKAGADFTQTQCIFNMEKFRDFMKKIVDMGLHEKCYILAGVHLMAILCSGLIASLIDCLFHLF